MAENGKRRGIKGEIKGKRSEGRRKGCRYERRGLRERALGKEDAPRCRCLLPTPPASCSPGPAQREAAACGSARDGAEGRRSPTETAAGRGCCLQPACRLAQWRGRRPPGDEGGSSSASPSPAATFGEAESSTEEPRFRLWETGCHPLPPRAPGEVRSFVSSPQVPPDTHSLPQTPPQCSQQPVATPSPGSLCPTSPPRQLLGSRPLPRAGCAPRRREQERRSCDRGATAPPSPSPYRFPPWAGAPSALKRNLADLAVLSPGQPGVHLAWPGRESLGAPELGKGWAGAPASSPGRTWKLSPSATAQPEPDLRNQIASIVLAGQYRRCARTLRHLTP